jgi:parvulin-like peptidyl-prolyl isomerase
LFNFPGKSGFAFIILLLFLSIFFISCNKDNPALDENTLALIGHRIITKEDFIKRYKYFRMKTGGGVPDTYYARRQVLNSYVDEQLLLIEAGKRGYRDDTEGKHERARIEMQERLHAFSRKMIADKIKVSDDELKRLFTRLNTRIKARHLYAASKEQADSLYDCLNNGAGFEELAQTTFEDPQLRDSGGLLGYFTVDEMDPDFENAAFELEIGEISKPVKTSQGYSIIRVDDRIARPVLTEFEFAKNKDKLFRYWHRRKIKQAVQAFSDSIGKQLDISFNKPVINELYAKFQERSQADAWAKERPIPKVDDLDSLKDKELLRSKLGKWHVATFQEKARFTSEKQHNWIRSKDRFQEFIAGLVVRDYILAKAREAGIHKQPEYLEKANEKWDDYLYDRIEANLKAEMVIPEDSLRSYYHEEPERFANPPAINLREIVLQDKATADVVAKKLANGESFAELAKTYSVRKWSAAKGGELGFLEPVDFGKWAQTVFSLKIGQQTGPVRMDSMFVFLQCLDKKPARLRSFAEARPEVEETVRYLAWEDYRRAKITAIRQSVANVKVFPERLKTIRLK